MRRALLGSVAALLAGAAVTFAQEPQPSPGLLPWLLTPAQPTQAAQPTTPSQPGTTPAPASI